MLTSSTAKRFRAVIIALAISFLTNYAISYAARSGGAGQPDPNQPKPRVEVLQAQIPQP